MISVCWCPEAAQFTILSSFGGEKGGSDPESGGESGKWCWRGCPLKVMWVTDTDVFDGCWSVVMLWPSWWVTTDSPDALSCDLSNLLFAARVTVVVFLGAGVGTPLAEDWVNCCWRWLLDVELLIELRVGSGSLRSEPTTNASWKYLPINRRIS